jgi:hypothetical protein
MNYDPKPSLETWRERMSDYERKYEQAIATGDESSAKFYRALYKVARRQVINAVNELMEDESDDPGKN